MATCKFKKLYEPLFTTQKRVYDILGGRGRGGSFTGTDYFLFLICRKQYFRGCFLRQSFNDIRASLFQDFKDRIAENPTVDEEDFDINEHEMRIVYRPTGNMIISKGVIRTSGRSAKLKSLAGISHVLIEEADEIGEEDFDQLDLSLRTTKISTGVRIIRIFNPPFKSHWIWRDYNLTEATPKDYFYNVPAKDIYYKASPKSDSNVIAMFSTYHDNLEFLDKTTVVKHESYLLRKPEYYYTIILGLISEGEKGRIFSGWMPITNSIFDNVDAKSMFALDFGLASPAGLIELKFLKNDMYVRELNYDPLTNKEIAYKLCQLGVKNETIVADSAEPDSISLLRRGWEMHQLDELLDKVTEEMENGEKVVKPRFKQLIDGFNIYPATKGKGSVKAGISAIKDMNVHVTEDSANLWTEYREYKWALDKNKNPTDEPIDQHNHLIDPMRYGCKDRERYY